MFFTKEDYLKIQEWLRRNSVKDSDLREAAGIQGNEIITIVLDGENVKIVLREFAELLLTLGVPDFINATDKYGAHSILLAISNVPYKARKLGQTVTYLNEDNIWDVYQFQGESLNLWNTISCWIDILKKASESVVPDNEDLITLEENGIRVIKFKNKIYNPDIFSGKGKVYLRKNITIVEDDSTHLGKLINLLTLSMLGKENTIYIILYDYDLNGQTITIPENCELKFEGGSVDNGTIVLNNTKILPLGCAIKDYIISEISGTYKRGQFLFDSTNNKMILWNGTKWVNLDGTELISEDNEE